MGSLGIDSEPNSTPKLTLSKLPCNKQRLIHQIQTNLTPPHQPLASIPFQWEDAPGKPRPIQPPSNTDTHMDTTKYNLDLPPRLLNEEAKITKIPPPTVVSDVGRSVSVACTLSFRKGSIMGRENGLRPVKRSREISFGSGRWECFKAGEFDSKGSPVFTATTLGDLFKNEKIVKNTRRKRGLFYLSGMNSGLWGDIYASFKHAIPCRRRC